MIPVQRPAVLLVIVVIACFSTWKVQDWRYGKQLAEIGEAQALAITEAGNVARQEEQRRQAAVNKEASDAREQNKAADAD
ncbi:DUF2514 family protein, partial [Klebsiella variicola]|uniref:DUF2514 family protein n=2 Tax=Gammaproteobacteria TaxID=1236 RepID=UPI0039C1FBD7